MQKVQKVVILVILLSQPRNHRNRAFSAIICPRLVYGSVAPCSIQSFNVLVCPAAVQPGDNLRRSVTTLGRVTH